MLSSSRHDQGQFGPKSPHASPLLSLRNPLGTEPNRTGRESRLKGRSQLGTEVGRWTNPSSTREDGMEARTALPRRMAVRRTVLQRHTRQARRTWTVVSAAGGDEKGSGKQETRARGWRRLWAGFARPLQDFGIGVKSTKEGGTGLFVVAGVGEFDDPRSCVGLCHRGDVVAPPPPVDNPLTNNTGEDPADLG